MLRLHYYLLYRLTEAYGDIDCAYDAVHNRTSRPGTPIGTTTWTATETYSTAAFSTRLSSVDDGSNVQSFAYTAAGNITTDDRAAGNDHGFLYNAANRLVEVQRNSLTEAITLTNALGERVVKDDAIAGISHTHYDVSERLIALGLVAFPCPLEQIHPDRAGEVAAALLERAFAVDLLDQGVDREALRAGAPLQGLPENLFQAEAGVVSGDGDGALADLRGGFGSHVFLGFLGLAVLAAAVLAAVFFAAVLLAGAFLAGAFLLAGFLSGEGPIIRAGSTRRSKSASLSRPSLAAACFRVAFSA